MQQLKAKFIENYGLRIVTEAIPPLKPLELIPGEVYIVSFKKPVKGRSLSANAYFHVLVDKLCKKVKVSFTACKNELITSYGVVECIDDVPLIYKTNAPPEYMREREEIHAKYIKTGDDGAHWYRIYKPSHEYDSKEFSTLLEGTINECKAQGIETLTPTELKRMLDEWEKHKEIKGQQANENSQRS